MSIYTSICIPHDEQIGAQAMPPHELRGEYISLLLGEGGRRSVAISMTPEQAKQVIKVIQKVLVESKGGHCEYCDGTGDVHSMDGEWRGACHCITEDKEPAA